MSRFAILVGALLLIASWAQADSLKLKNGGVIEGVVTEDKDSFTVEVPYGTMKIGRELVDSVTKRETPLSEHRARAAALAENDTEGWFKLGQWARAHSLERLAIDDFQRALAVDPDHAGARAALGYEKADGKWLTHDEVMAAKGFVKVDGAWVTKEAGELMKALADAKAIEAESRVAEQRARAEEDLALRRAALEEQRERFEEREREAQLAEERYRRTAYYDSGYYAYGSFYSYPVYNPFPFGGNDCHQGTPYIRTQNGLPVTIERQNGQNVWVQHSGGCVNDQHSVIHQDGDGHLVTEQIVNGQQVLVHQTAPGAPPDITLQHR